MTAPIEIVWERGPITKSRARVPQDTLLLACTTYALVVVLPFTRERVSLQLLCVVFDR